MEESKLLLKGVLKNVAKEQNYKDYEVNLKVISSGGANFTGYLFLATILNLEKMI